MSATIVTAGPKNPDIANCNVFYMLMMAISDSSKSVSRQQMADTQTTINFGKMENAINEEWYNPIWGTLTRDISKINPNDGGMGQAQFNEDQARAQQAASQADSLVQMSNSQSSTDSTNIQNINQLGSTMNIMSYIANLLAH
jgi:hypothetical protein